MSKGIELIYQSGQEPCILSVLSLGEADNLFHQQLEQSLKIWIDNLAAVVEDTGIEPELARQKAENAIMLIQGSLVLVRITKNTQPFKRAVSKLPQILLEDQKII